MLYVQRISADHWSGRDAPGITLKAVFSGVTRLLNDGLSPDRVN